MNLKIGGRVILYSPYGFLSFQYSPYHRDVWKIPSGTWGTVTRDGSGFGEPGVQFDGYLAVTTPPLHWLQLIREARDGQLELPLGGYYEVTPL